MATVVQGVGVVPLSTSQYYIPRESEREARHRTGSQPKSRTASDRPSTGGRPGPRARVLQVMSGEAFTSWNDMTKSDRHRNPTGVRTVPKEGDPLSIEMAPALCVPLHTWQARMHRYTKGLGYRLAYHP